MDIETAVSNRDYDSKVFTKLVLRRSNESFFSLAVSISFGFEEDFFDFLTCQYQSSVKVIMNHRGNKNIV